MLQSHRLNVIEVVTYERTSYVSGNAWQQTESSALFERTDGDAADRRIYFQGISGLWIQWNFFRYFATAEDGIDDRLSTRTRTPWTSRRPWRRNEEQLNLMLWSNLFERQRPSRCAEVFSLLYYMIRVASRLLRTPAWLFSNNITDTYLTKLAASRRYLFSKWILCYQNDWM